MMRTQVRPAILRPEARISSNCQRLRNLAQSCVTPESHACLIAFIGHWTAHVNCMAILFFRIAHCRTISSSGGQSLAADATAVGKNLAAIASRHAGAESKLAFAMKDMRLICTFLCHGLFLIIGG